MSKKVIKKDEHVCHLCGRISASPSVLRGVTNKKTNETVYHCTNSKKCKQDKAGGLVDGQRKKKKAPVKKKAIAKKAEEAQPEMVEAI